MLGLHQEIARFNATPIFVTQKRGDYRKRNGKMIGLVITNAAASRNFADNRLGFLEPGTANGLDYYRVLSMFNTVLMEVCGEVNGVCIDLASELEFEPGDFYDHVHNTQSGAKRIGEYLFGKLKDQFPGESAATHWQPFPLRQNLDVFFRSLRHPWLNMPPSIGKSHSKTHPIPLSLMLAGRADQKAP